MGLFCLGSFCHRFSHQIPGSEHSEVRPDIKVEDALVLASEYLSCAAATAYETADNITLEFRPLARSVLHQIEAARALVEASVAGLEDKSRA